MEAQLLTDREAELAALVPNIEKALRDALMLRSIEYCLMNRAWNGDRDAARAKSSAIEMSICDVLKSLQGISQTQERKDIPR